MPIYSNTISITLFILVPKPDPTTYDESSLFSESTFNPLAMSPAYDQSLIYSVLPTSKKSIFLFLI